MRLRRMLIRRVDNFPDRPFPWEDDGAHWLQRQRARDSEVWEMRVYGMLTVAALAAMIAAIILIGR